MTAQDVYDRALVLLAETNGGDPDYEATAPLNIDMLQQELAKAEGVTATPIMALTDTISVSDYTALVVLPYGLAAKFALADKDQDNYQAHRNDYERLKLTVGVTETDTTDAMGIVFGSSDAEDFAG